MRKWNVGETRSPAGVPWDIMIRDEENDPICSVCRAGWDRISAQKHARLIAAAPELLAACKALIERFGIMSDGCIKMGGDAIAKAEGRMHHAKIETSDRLQRLLALLRQGGWWTTRELMLGTGSCAQATDISELRSNGFDVESRRLKSELGTKRQVWSYRIHEVDAV